MRDVPSIEFGAVVAVLTRDLTLTDALALAVDELDSAVELHVVEGLDLLREHLDRARPDATVVDVEALDGVSLEQVLQHGDLRCAPIVVVDGHAGAECGMTALQLGAVAHVAREPGFEKRLAQIVLDTGRQALLSGSAEETERHYREILDALTDGVFVLASGKFGYVNEPFADAVGHAPRALVGMLTLTDLVPESSRHRVDAHLARLEVSGGERVAFETRLVTPDGERGPFEVTCHASRVHGCRAIVGVARDVAEDRRLQAELQQSRQRASQVERLRALGELAAGVAHDFNNAIGTIAGRVALAREKLGRGDSVASELDVILTAARHAIATVHRIQDFTRPRDADAWHDLDLRAVVEDAVSLVRTDVPSSVAFDVDLKPTPTVRGNSGQLLEVVLNLLRNALEAIGSHGTVRARCYDDGGWAVVEVEDDGDGLDDEARAHMFEPFFTTKGVTGTGLGLSMSHWILRHHDAHIDCHSDIGVGTRFVVSFAPPQKPARRSKEPELSKDRLSVVVVDDDPSVADMLTDLLRDQGYDATVVRTAADAMLVIDAVAPDVLLTDLSLPDMSGWELARRVRDRRPGIFVGLITGWPISAPDEEIKSRGVDVILGKPFSLEALNDALARVRRR